MDLALFKWVRERGMAFDDDARPSQELPPPLGDSNAAWPQLRGLVKGSMDVQAALDTSDAQRLRATLSKLPASGYKAFSESIGLPGSIGTVRQWRENSRSMATRSHGKHGLKAPLLGTAGLSTMA